MFIKQAYLFIQDNYFQEFNLIDQETQHKIIEKLEKHDPVCSTPKSRLIAPQKFYYESFTESHLNDSNCQNIVDNINFKDSSASATEDSFIIKEKKIHNEAKIYNYVPQKKQKQARFCEERNAKNDEKIL